MSGIPAIDAIRLEPIVVIDLPADSLLGVTRQGPDFDFSCLTSGSGVLGSGAAGLAGSAWPTALLASAATRISQKKNPKSNDLEVRFPRTQAAIKSPTCLCSSSPKDLFLAPMELFLRPPVQLV
jgi:hypothetical protein